MTTTFPPSEVSVRRSLVAFQLITGTCVMVIMILLVISLSMGYALCTAAQKRDELEGKSRSLVDRRRLVNSAESPFPGDSHGHLHLTGMQQLSSL